MKSLLAVQFDQFWRMFADIVNDFNDDNWRSLGYGMTMPMKLAYHILHSIRYYIGDEGDSHLNSGKEYKYSIERVDETNFLSRNEIIELIDKTKHAVTNWIQTIDLNEANTVYPWTGSNRLSVVLFIIRHSYYHLGEFNGLLNDNLSGNAKDHFADNIY